MVASERAKGEKKKQAIVRIAQTGGREDSSRRREACHFGGFCGLKKRVDTVNALATFASGRPFITCDSPMRIASSRNVWIMPGKRGRWKLVLARSISCFDRTGRWPTTPAAARRRGFLTVSTLATLLTLEAVNILPGSADFVDELRQFGGSVELDAVFLQNAIDAAR
jgi:hypothetical protein